MNFHEQPEVIGTLPLSNVKANIINIGSLVDDVEKCVALLKMKDGLNLGTAIAIHNELVMVSKHCIESLDVRNMEIVLYYNGDNDDKNKEIIPLQGVVEEFSNLDYAILRLSRRINGESAIAKLAFLDSSQLPVHAVLIHHPRGGYKQVSYGNILTYYTTMSIPIAQALIYSDVMSSGGGYFTPPNLCLGMHIAIGHLGISPTKEFLTFKAILQGNRKSLLHKLSNNQELQASDLQVTKTITSSTILGEQNPLIFTREEISIPIIYTLPLRSSLRAYSSFHRLSTEQEKFFYKALSYGIATEHIAPSSDMMGTTIVSMGKDGLYRDSLSRNKELNVDGIRIDCLGYTGANYQYCLYQACVNVEVTNPAMTKEEKQTGPRRDLDNTIIARVEVSNPALYYSRGRNILFILTNRLRLALYRSYQQQMICRVA